MLFIIRAISVGPTLELTGSESANDLRLALFI